MQLDGVVLHDVPSPKDEKVRFRTKPIDPSEFNQHLAAGCIYYQLLPIEALTPLLISSAKEEDFDYQCQIKLLERDVPDRWRAKHGTRLLCCIAEEREGCRGAPGKH